jgi:hypothetical protein
MRMGVFSSELVVEQASRRSSWVHGAWPSFQFENDAAAVLALASCYYYCLHHEEGTSIYICNFHRQ